MSNKPPTSDHMEDNVKKLEAGVDKTEAPVSANDAALKDKEKTDPGTEATTKVMTAEAKNEANEVAKENSELKGMVEGLMSRVKTLEETLAKNHSEATTVVNELETKNKALEAQVSANHQQSINDFCESLIRNGQLRPADRDMTMMALKAQDDLDKAPVYNMSEKQDPNKKTRLEQYKEKLLAMPKVVQFGEFPNLPVAQTGVSFPAPTDAGTMSSYIEQKVSAKMAEQDKLGLTSKVSYEDTLKGCMAEAEKEYPAAYRAYFTERLMPGMPKFR